MVSHKILISLLNLVVISVLILPLRAQNLAQEVQDHYVRAHNVARWGLKHFRGFGAVLPEVGYNATLARYAQKWAKKRISDCNLTHSGGPYGENLAKGSNRSFSIISAVKLWAAEEPYYDYRANACTQGKPCLEFTQLMWFDSVHVGCGRAKCSDGSYYVVCSYDPPGNVPGKWPY